MENGGFDDDRRMFSLEQPSVMRMSSAASFEGDQRQQLIALLQQALSALQENQHPVITPAAPKKRHWLSSKFTSRLLLFSSVWVGITLGLLALLDATVSSDDLERPVQNSGFLTGAIIIIILLVIWLVVIVGVSIKLTKQMLHHTASSSFLIQSYLSTILMYSAFYTVIFRLDAASWADVYNEPAAASSYVGHVYVRMLYFSISTMTSTGYGDIHPDSWYTYLMVCTQMLIGVLYSTVILARGLDLLAGKSNTGLKNNYKPVPNEVLESRA
eukprot:m.18281 g.18281  ORF g.18281 m.18281 type:complete len:271 (-) comp7325_c1_seq1:39-851(-)